VGVTDEGGNDDGGGQDVKRRGGGEGHGVLLGFGSAGAPLTTATNATARIDTGPGENTCDLSCRKPRAGS
jgi:hypothetical protein